MVVNDSIMLGGTEEQRKERDILEEQVRQARQDAIEQACLWVKKTALLGVEDYRRLMNDSRSRGVLIRHLAKEFLLDARDGIFALEVQNYFEESPDSKSNS